MKIKAKSNGLTRPLVSWQVFKQHNLPLLQLALPILGAHLAQTGMSVADTIMAGRLSPVDLAAVAVGASVFMPLLLLLFGTLLATTPLVAQAKGAGTSHQLAPTIYQAWYSGFILLIPLALVIFYSGEIFAFMQVEASIADLAQGYLHALIWGLPAVASFQVLRCLCEGYNHARPVLLISLAGLLLNIPANYVLIYGKFGLPELGAIGCGYATALSFWFMAFLLAIYVHKAQIFAQLKLFQRIILPNLSEIKAIYWLGLPIGLAIFVEVSLFTVITLFIGELGEITVAGHQVALNFTGLLFMVPLSLGTALTVKVGQAIGAKQPVIARQVAFYGLGLALMIALVSSLVMWLVAPWVVQLYTPNLEVQLLAISLIHLAVWYQISDAIQINAAGALRGYKDTRVVMLITLISYWCIGMAGGNWLAFHIEIIPPLGVHGFWYGLIAGLSVAAVLLIWRLASTAKKQILTI